MKMRDGRHPIIGLPALALAGAGAGHVAPFVESDGGEDCEDGGTLPLVDPDVLADLGRQLDNSAMAHRFAHDYVSLWDLRRRRLTSALSRNDLSDALDATLSLKTASAMLGARRLAWLAEQLEDMLWRGELRAGLEFMDEITDQGHATVNELRWLSAPGG